MRLQNLNNIIIGTLNINSLANKFDYLKHVINSNLDIFILQETKLDSSFPVNRFIMDGYKIPYRLDRNRKGGGVMIYVRDDIPSCELSNHNFTKPIEGLFIEINLRKMKLLLFGTYHSTHPIYGIKNADYFEQVGLALDVYNKYDKFLLAGDFNVEDTNNCLKDFLFQFNAKNIVKEKTCFKNPENPSCIDLFLTNSNGSFFNTKSITTGLSDFHNLVLTVMRTTFPKAKPKIIEYRDYKRLNIDNFEYQLKNSIVHENLQYARFEKTFLEVLEEHAPIKKKIVRANDKPYMTKALRKAMMRRTFLKNKFYKNPNEESKATYKKQKNFTDRLLRKEKKKYFSNLDLNNLTDNKKFWSSIKPLFSNFTNSNKISLVDGWK